MTIHLTLELTDEQLDAIAELAARKLGKVTENPLTISEFAVAVKESRSTINNKVRAGIIQKSKNPGVTRIPHSELERYRNGGKPLTK